MFSCEGRKASVKASADDIAKLFRLAHVKDEATEPASVRGKTYMQMAQAVIDGADKKNYIWSSDIGIFFDGCAKLDNKSKGITEDKMYIRQRRQEGLMSPGCARPLAPMYEAGGLPAIAKVAGISANARITSVVRQDTIYSTVQAMGLPCKINAMRNVVAEVPDMQTAGAALQTIYQQFGVKGSFMVTWEGKGKLYWAPDTPVDRRQAVSYANQMGLPPPDARRYMEQRDGYPAREYLARGYTARGYPARRY